MLWRLPAYLAPGLPSPTNSSMDQAISRRAGPGMSRDRTRARLTSCRPAQPPQLALLPQVPHLAHLSELPELPQLLQPPQLPELPLLPQPSFLPHTPKVARW